MNKSTSVAIAAAGASAFIIAHYLLRRRSTLKANSVGITIIGDIFLDLVVSTHQLPSWGADVIVDEPICAMAGGSGLNTATHLSSTFRIHTALWSALGKHDAWGAIIRRHASEVGFYLRGALECASTGVCVVVSGDDRGFLTHRGPIADLCLDTDAVSSSIRSAELLGSMDPQGHLHLAGYYNCPRLWGTPTAQLLRRARIQGCSTSLNAQFDASGEWAHLAGSVLPQVDVMFVSADEAAHISGIPRNLGESEDGADDCSGDPYKSTVSAAHWFIDNGCSIAVVTLGRHGALALFKNDAVNPASPRGHASREHVGASDDLLRKQRKLLVQPIRAGHVKVVDTTGAGDAFTSGFLFGWRCDLKVATEFDSRKEGDSHASRVVREAAVAEGLRWGVAAGTACVGHMGASTPMDMSEVEGFLPGA